MKTFSQFEDNKNNNFNLIRLIAALIVLYTHSYGLSGKLPDKFDNPIAYFIYLMGNVGVDMFFLVSGYLVTRSYIKRKKLTVFLWARLLRIIPGLACALFFSVFVIGALETQLDIRDYLRNKDIYNYFMVNLSLIKTVSGLPGVFEGNYYSNQVNGSLWTLPAEIRLYLYVALLGVLGFFQRRWMINSVVMGLITLYYFAPQTIPLISDDQLYYYPALLFVMGSLFYVNRSFIPCNGLLLIALFISLISIVIYQYSYKNIVYTLFLLYFVFWFAYNLPILNYFNKIGDYSYGMYIYAFPIQQFIISHNRELGVNQFFLYSVLATLVLAVLSWHFIEKKFLQLK